eukprot:358308-Chlamydomonas_euryale.AAC.4
MMAQLGAGKRVASPGGAASSAPPSPGVASAVTRRTAPRACHLRASRPAEAGVFEADGQEADEDVTGGVGATGVHGQTGPVAVGEQKLAVLVPHMLQRNAPRGGGRRAAVILLGGRSGQRTSHTAGVETAAYVHAENEYTSMHARRDTHACVQERTHMHACMHACMREQTYKHACANRHTSMHARTDIHACMRGQTHMHACENGHTCVHARTDTHACMREQTYKHACEGGHTCMRARTDTHTCMREQTHTHACMQEQTHMHRRNLLRCKLPFISG